MFFQSLDRGYELLALQSALIQVIRVGIRCCDECHTALEQGREQPAENHGIADIADKKLVKAQDRRIARDVVSNLVEWILDIAERLHTFVNVAQHAVKMDSFLVLHSQRLEEQVHQERLATPNTAPEISAPDVAVRRRIRAPEETADTALRPVFVQPLSQIVEQIDNCLLGHVSFVAMGKEAGFVGLANSQNSGYPFS
jgi:hypothetical protein